LGTSGSVRGAVSNGRPYRKAIASVPLSRIGTADDLGRAAVFLASDDSAYITSIELFVDGGVAQI
jgi:NAD(P)-dependent dehydrogenase (short-subunit alcohol dehydrogenase family)